jgi:hypothetical protein
LDKKLNRFITIKLPSHDLILATCNQSHLPECSARGLPGLIGLCGYGKFKASHERPNAPPPLSYEKLEVRQF